ncbi:MAG TPA: hypothetical protein VJ872_10400 [Nocardioides sp.]|nr:hypothetical protein [Nocardioides sp.]
MNRRHWFGRRRTSYGGVPITWQGWVSVAVLALLTALAAALLPWPASVPVGAVALLAFLVLSVAKGPIHTRWRWGQDD